VSSAAEYNARYGGRPTVESTLDQESVLVDNDALDDALRDRPPLHVALEHLARVGGDMVGAVIDGSLASASPTMRIIAGLEELVQMVERGRIARVTPGDDRLEDGVRPRDVDEARVEEHEETRQRLVGDLQDLVGPCGIL